MSERCGTYGGVNDHVRSGETVCDDCRIAAATYQTQRRRRIALGMPVRGRECDDLPHWFEVAGDMATVGATIRRAFMEGA